MNRAVPMAIGSTAVLLYTAVTCRAQDRIWYAESNIRGDAFGPTSVGPDLDGDGLPDLLISAIQATCTNQFDGWVGLYSTTGGQLQQWCGTGGALFGTGLAWIDDIDGGGVADFVVGESDYYDPVTWGSGTGRIRVFSSETGNVLYDIVGMQGHGSFGNRLDVVDDCDGDGIRDLLVGGPSYGASVEGRAWIFSMRTGTEIRTHVGPAAYTYYGNSVGHLNDVDGDGVGDYAVAAPMTTNLGRLNVYSGRTGSRLLKVDGSGAADNLGLSIAAPGDLDGDGLADVIVGGYTANGHIDAYSPISGHRIWRIDGVTNQEGFGWRCLALPDLNRDGYDEILVSAIYDDHDGRDDGRVDLISGRSHRALYHFYPGIPGIDLYGSLLAHGADFNGDGIEDLIIGTPNGGTKKAKGGHTAIFAGNDLFLQADPIAPLVGDTVTIDLRGGEPGLLGLIALIAIDGSPLFESLLLASFDANGELQLTADIPPEAAGIEYTLFGYAQNPMGRGPLPDSSPAIVSVQ